MCNIINRLECDLILNKANIGDSRAVASVAGRVDPLSIDHKPTCPEEKNRVISAGGWVQFNRVNGNLALSRAFGDFVFKRNEKRSAIEQIVIAHPDVQTRPLNNKLEFIVMACDGVWDVMTNEEVIEFCRRRLAHHMSPVSICEELITRCLAPDCQMGSGIGCDNMTVILICYLNGATFESFCKSLNKTNFHKTSFSLNYSMSAIEKRIRRVKLNVDNIIINCDEEDDDEEDDDVDVDDAQGNDDEVKINNTLDKDDASDSETSECNSSASYFDDPMLQKNYDDDNNNNTTITNDNDNNNTSSDTYNLQAKHVSNSEDLVNGTIVITSGENARPEVVMIQMNKSSQSVHSNLNSSVTGSTLTTSSVVTALATTPTSNVTSHEQISNLLNNNN